MVEVEPLYRRPARQEYIFNTFNIQSISTHNNNDDVVATLASRRLPKQSVAQSQQLAVDHVTVSRD